MPFDAATYAESGATPEQIGLLAQAYNNPTVSTWQGAASPEAGGYWGGADPQASLDTVGATMPWWGDYRHKVEHGWGGMAQTWSDTAPLFVAAGAYFGGLGGGAATESGASAEASVGSGYMGTGSSAASGGGEIAAQSTYAADTQAMFSAGSTASSATTLTQALKGVQQFQAARQALDTQRNLAPGMQAGALGMPSAAMVKPAAAPGVTGTSPVLILGAGLVLVLVLLKRKA